MRWVVALFALLAVSHAWAIDPEEFVDDVHDPEVASEVEDDSLSLDNIVEDLNGVMAKAEAQQAKTAVATPVTSKVADLAETSATPSEDVLNRNAQLVWAELEQQQTEIRSYVHSGEYASSVKVVLEALDKIADKIKKELSDHALAYKNAVNAKESAWVKYEQAMQAFKDESIGYQKHTKVAKKELALLKNIRNLVAHLGGNAHKCKEVEVKVCKVKSCLAHDTTCVKYGTCEKKVCAPCKDVKDGKIVQSTCCNSFKVKCCKESSKKCTKSVCLEHTTKRVTRCG